VIVAVPWREWPVSAPFVNRFVSSPATLLTAPEKLDVLTNGRWRIYGASVEAFVNAPLKSQLLGVGYNGSRESLAGSLGRLVSTHSVYLQVLLDFGILGTLLFLCLLVFLLDWTRMGVLNWFWRNAVIVTYLLTFGALAWLLSWSDIVLFACVGTPSFKYLYSRHVVERG
jgi:O-antigen ligase